MTKTTEELILQELFNLSHKIDKFQDETRKDIKELRTEMNKNDEALITEMHENINSLRTELKQDIGDLRTEMHENIDSLRIDISKTLTKEEYKKDMEAQSKEIAEIFTDTFKTLEKREKNILLKIAK